jgi:hypothetical protein
MKTKQLIMMLCLLFCLGCSSDENEKAELIYQQAKSRHNIDELVEALTVLERLGDVKYLPKLLKAKQARRKYLDSVKHMREKNYYLAYLSSHDSLQQMYSVESKTVLIESGGILLPLIKVKDIFERSKQIPRLFSQYKNLPIIDWNLLEVNLSLKEYSKNISSLEKAMRIISKMKTNYTNRLLPELNIIELKFEVQLKQIHKEQKYLIDLALFRNAELLIKLNDKLSQENFSISQIFNKNKIDEAMVPFIVKAKNRYALNKYIIENMFFAASFKAKKHHMIWFEKWKELERDILEPTDGFIDYSHKTSLRNERLALYVDKTKIDLSKIKEDILKSDSIFKESKVIRGLIDKLSKDHRFFV